MDTLSQAFHQVLVAFGNLFPSNGTLGAPRLPYASDNGPDMSGNGIQPSYVGNDQFPGAPTIAHYPSASFQFRLEGNDLQSWLEPTQQDRNNFMTFFNGNQLPGFNLNSPIGGYGALQSVHIESPSRNSGTFGPNLGQLNTQSLWSRWQSIWQAASGS